MTERPQKHSVAVRVGQKVLEGWSDYTIECDMLHPADSFQLQLGGGTKEAWDLCKPDTQMQVLIDDTVMMSGRIDRRLRRGDRSGSALWISGRDRSARLVDESMELRSFANLTIADLVVECAKPWFTKVIFTNAANRDAVRGKNARKARAKNEAALSVYDPAAIWGKKRERRVNPGEFRWTVIRRHLEEVGLIAWSTADGTALVVGQPNYNQEIQYRFFASAPGTDRAGETNVNSFSYAEDIGERYSQVTCVGSGRGDHASFAVDVQHGAIVTNGPGPFGTGKDFLEPKRYVIADDKVTNKKLGEIRAQREMAERDASGKKLTLSVDGHGQFLDATHPETLFAFDTLASWEDEEFGIRGTYLLTTIRFSHSRQSGETTEIELVPKGTLLKGA